MKIELIKEEAKHKKANTSLFFVHGGSHGAWCWKEYFMPYFAEQGYDCYAISVRGHGNSEGLENLHNYTLDDYVEDVFQEIQKIEEDIILIGHSIGGAIVQRFLQYQENMIKAAVLMNSVSPDGMKKDFLRIMVKNFKDAMKIPSFNSGRSLDFPEKLFFSKNITQEAKEKYLGLVQPESLNVSREVRERIVPEDTMFELPMLVLGSNKDRIFSSKRIRRIAEFYGGSCVIFDDFCHDMMLDEKWRMVADEIKIFIERVIL